VENDISPDGELHFLPPLEMEPICAANTTSVNNAQFVSGFDHEFQVALAALPGWHLQASSKWPRLSKEVGWDAKPDIVVQSHRDRILVIEVEKGNKYKVYDDLMKLRPFANSGSNTCGVLICPTNNPNRWAMRDPHAYAKRAMRLLRIAAGVTDHFFERLALIGYTQSILEGDRPVPWTPQLRSGLDRSTASTVSFSTRDEE
jgi:hypothetical protein